MSDILLLTLILLVLAVAALIAYGKRGYTWEASRPLTNQERRAIWRDRHRAAHARDELTRQPNDWRLETHRARTQEKRWTITVPKNRPPSSRPITCAPISGTSSSSATAPSVPTSPSA